MKLRIGYELDYDFPQPTPVILMLHVHFSRVSDLAAPDYMRIQPSVPVSAYRDSFGNWCSRLLAPQGHMRITADAVISDSGLPEVHDRSAGQVPVERLPEECIAFLLPSRFCDSDRLLDLAWQLFGHTQPGAPRVQAICDFVHQRIAFNYNDASVTRTASDAYREGRGVCRDYAHLAIAFCRAMNIPARYCTCYLGDVGTPPPYPPGDFAASFEAYLDGGWQMFDPRNNVARIGRVLIARGRDAADVAIATTFGPNTLTSFRVWTDEVVEVAQAGSLGFAAVAREHHVILDKPPSGPAFGRPKDRLRGADPGSIVELRNPPMDPGLRFATSRMTAWFRDQMTCLIAK